MRAYNLSPLFRSSVGFDRVANMLDELVGIDQSKSNYPPYNIEQKGENEFRITLAVAGFDENELSIEADQNQLTVSGKKLDAEQEVNFLHRGIASRDFERRFHLADYVKVASASVSNGLLYVELRRELPEVLKPRTIKIQSSATNPASLGSIGERTKQDAA